MVFIILLASNCKVLVGGEFPVNVRLDLVIFLDVLHLRAFHTNPRALRQGASRRRGNATTMLLMVVFTFSAFSADSSIVIFVFLVFFLSWCNRLHCNCP